MKPKHDFVIVGAGSSGCALAARLTEDPSCRVLLLEAGGSDRGLDVRVPAAFPKLFKTARDWNYTTAPVSPLAGRELFWPRAKMLGGCSSMNAQCYVRGNPADYDLWEDLGNPGWGFRDVLPYFRRAEGYTEPTEGLHGNAGPLRVERLRDPNPATEWFLAAAAEMGLPILNDVNGRTQLGAAHMRVNHRSGRRHSAADAYLRPAMRRPNLKVVTNVHVTRIVFAGRTAQAVDYTREGQQERATFGELLVAAGTVNSPQLLMLSGVGPAAELRALGIRVVADLPGVGRNLQDHLAVAVIHRCREPISLLSAPSVLNLLRFLVRGRGMLTSNVAEACAFMKTRNDLAAPDLEFIFAPAPFVRHGLEPQTEHALTIGPVLLQPASRGVVQLRSSNPFEAPELRPGYLTDPHGADLATLVRGVEIAREMFAAPSLAKHVDGELRPGVGVSAEQAIRTQSETLYHPVGTCKMGTDDQAVVDGELRVRGLERLRVIDASVMPTIIRGHTHAPAVMIGERGADLCLGRGIAATRTPPRAAVEPPRSHAPDRATLAP